MLALTLLLLAIGWLLVAVVSGFLAYKGTRKRWVQVATAIVVLWLPFWDVIPGWILYQKAVREVGGVRIYKTVEAEGYLDRSATDCYSCWSQLNGSSYEYLEVERTVSGGALSVIEPDPGFYEYRLDPLEESSCAAFNELPNADLLRSNHAIGRRCVISTVSSTPVSRYEVRSEATNFKDINSPWRIRLNKFQVRDRINDELLAESVQVYFTSWLGRFVGIPRWQFTDLDDGRHIEVDLKRILIPE